MDNRHKITYILSRLSIIEETESGNFCDGVKSKRNFPKNNMNAFNSKGNAMLYI